MKMFKRKIEIYLWRLVKIFIYTETYGISLLIQKLLIKKNGAGGVFYIIFNVLFMLSTLFGLIIISGAAAATKITWLPIVLIVIWVALTIIKIYNLIIRRKVDLSKI